MNSEPDMEAVLSMKASYSQVVKNDGECRLKGYHFSPFKRSRAFLHTSSVRIGVPGYPLYGQNLGILKHWAGSSFQAVFTHALFWIYLILLAIAVTIFSSIEYTAAVQATVIPSNFHSVLRTTTVFTLTFFLNQTFSEANTRFECVCKTNGNVTRLSALAGSLFPPDGARLLMRYCNAIMHIYYLLLSGPMDEEKWEMLKRRGLLTEEEIEALQLQGSPGVVVHSWALSALTSLPMATKTKDVSDQLLAPFINAMEQQFGGTRGLSAKQIAYTIYQIPSVYFHVVYFTVNMYLTFTVYEAGHDIGLAMSAPCSPESGGDKCMAKVCTIIVTEVLLILLFLALLIAATGLSDIYGNTRPFQYDLGVDLDALWQESKNVLKSCEVGCPSLQTRSPHGKIHGDTQVQTFV